MTENTLYSRGNPYTVVAPTGTYSASETEFVISDGSDITLPSPVQDGLVAVRAAPNTATTVLPPGSATVQLQSNGVELDAGEGAVFVSDGANWYVENQVRFTGLDIPDTGIARYEFEQDVTDSWNNNDGTDNTSAGYSSTTVKQGTYSKIYDGTNDYVTIPDVFDGLAAASFGGYFYLDGSGTSYPRLIGCSNNNFRIYLDNNDIWNFDVNGSGIAEGSKSYTKGNWVFIVSVYDSNGLGDGSTAKIYRDDAVEIASGSPSTSNIGAGSKELARKAGGGDIMGGYQDDVRIYNKALTSSEVSNWFNSGSI